MLVECLKKILDSAENMRGQTSVNHKNALNAILFEAIDLIITLNLCASSSALCLNRRALLPPPASSTVISVIAHHRAATRS
jgi:hypothetical protein